MNSARRSLIGTVIGGAFWGLSGTAAQALFQIYGFPVVGLVTIRMLAGGLVLLLAMRPSMPRRGDGLFRLFVIAIFGIAGSQLTYLLAIQYSNAPTGTLLQFLFLPIVAGYEAFTGSLKWSVRWTAALIFASLGTILLIGLVSSVDTIEILVTPIGLARSPFCRLWGLLLTRFPKDSSDKGGLVARYLGLHYRRGCFFTLRRFLHIQVFSSCFEFGRSHCRSTCGLRDRLWHNTFFWALHVRTAKAFCHRDRDSCFARTDNGCCSSIFLSQSAAYHPPVSWRSLDSSRSCTDSFKPTAKRRCNSPNLNSS